MAFIKLQETVISLFRMTIPMMCPQAKPRGEQICPAKKYNLVVKERREVVSKLECCYNRIIQM